ncbi:hypothetical protein DXU07_31405 [Bradyrhizobium elkanii]|nr:hypothetical protein BLN97_07045 [Bradyrhizobium elkanii]QOZ19040.1 hypothetical protein XI02_31435 [Bradyrhizobium sp. CCBAU 21365]
MCGIWRQGSAARTAWAAVLHSLFRDRRSDAMAGRSGVRSARGDHTDAALGKACGPLAKVIFSPLDAAAHGMHEHLVFQPGEAATARGKQLRMSSAGQHQADSFPRVLSFN